KQLGATMIYVTHDQTEAMTMGDRIVVMKDGIINQVDTPMNLYNKPVNQFVAGFIGSPAMNFIDSSVLGENEVCSKDGKLKFSLTVKQKNHLKDYLNKEIIIGIRPENIRLENELKNSIELDVLIDVIEPMGNETFIYFEVEKNPCIARVKPSKELKVGEIIKLYIDPKSVYVFDKKLGKNIFHTAL
ncbi:MAG: ABC transporter ATP-binding protein, partial [Ignavibacteria bacterium]|nr:ABC transporter ATP-binding protein [Ignavibacteria bacterium]